MTRGRRWILRVLALLALLGAGTYLFVWRPVADAAAFLARLNGPALDAAAFAAAGARTWPAVEGGDGTASVPRCLVFDGPDATAPLLLVIAGVTPEGIDDARVAQLALACRAAGFGVVSPELVRLARPGEGPDPTAAVLQALAAAHVSGAGRWDASRCGILGVSLGGGVALRAALEASRASPPHPVAAVLLVGAPDDARVLATDWFRLSIARDKSDRTVAAHSEAGIFARHAVLRAALPALVPASEVAPLRLWIDTVGENSSGPAPSPVGVGSPEAAHWVAVMRAEADARSEDVAWALAAAEPSLALTSPAAWGDELSRLDPRTSVYLLHGQTDPLVPVTEMGKLASRLSGHGPVDALESRLIAHVSLESPGPEETWRHLRFLTRFFDAVRTSR